MVIADYIDAHGAEHCSIFESFEDLHRATFSPACRIYDTVEVNTREDLQGKERQLRRPGRPN